MTDGEAERLRRSDELKRDYAHPMAVLAESLNLERRNLQNHPRHLFRLGMFVLPFLLILLVAPLVIPRDVALTVASAMLGVQLAVPYAGWVRRVSRLVDMSRTNDEHPLRFIRGYAAEYLFRNRATVWYGLSVSDDGLLISRGGQRGANKTLSRFKFRYYLEPAWRRHFGDFDGRVISSNSVTPAAFVHVYYSSMARWRPVLIVRLLLATQMLERVGRETRLVTLREDDDLPARNLARQYGLPYEFHTSFRARLRHYRQVLQLFGRLTRRTDKDSEKEEPASSVADA